jgi:hypothetical protein
VKEEGKEREEADSKLTAGLDTGISDYRCQIFRSCRDSQLRTRIIRGCKQAKC